MTVGELIAVLQGMPPDLPVLVSSFEIGYTEHFDVSMDIAAEDLAYEPEYWWAGRFQPLSDCLTPQSPFNAVLVTRGKAR
jgi:hypothetical protein